MKLRNIFGNKNNHAKVDTTVMIKLVFTDNNTGIGMYKRDFDIAIDLWQKHIKKAQVQALEYKVEPDPKDKDSVNGYFTPRTLSEFLHYFKHLVDNDTVIPHTDGQTLNCLKGDLFLDYNYFVSTSDGSPKTDSTGHGVLDHTEKLKSYPGVKFDDNFNSVLLILNTLLFFSYTNEDFDNIKNLHVEYNNDRDIASLLVKLYQAELNAAQEKPLSKGQIATIPSFQNFSKQNKNAVYIPNLTPKDQIKRATHPKRRDVHDTLDERVSQQAKGNGDSSIQHQRKIAALDKMIGQGKRKADLKESRHQYNGVTRPTSKVAHIHNYATSSSSSHSSTMPYSQQASAASTKPSSASSTTESKANSSKANPTRKSSVAKASRSSKSSASVSSAKSSSDVSQVSASKPSSVSIAKRPSSPINQSSPLITTNNANTLARSIKLLQADSSDYKPVAFQRFDTGSDDITPVSAENALKTGKLDNQRYVQVQDDHFKHTANQLIAQRQSELNLAFKRSEIDMVAEAHRKLVKTINKIITKYGNDDSLRKSTSRFYNQHYNYRSNALTRERNIKYNEYRKQLSLAFRSNLEKYLAELNNYRSTSLHRYADRLNQQTIRLFNDSRSKRNKDIREEINLTKKEAIRQLNLQLRNHRVEFKHRANEASQMLYNWLNHELDKSHGRWINIASKLISKQVNLDNAKIRLNQSKIDAVNSKSNKRRHAKLLHAMNSAQEYANHAEDKYSNLQDKLIALRSKYNDVQDDRDQYKFKITSLNGQIKSLSKKNDTDKNSILKSLQDAQSRNIHLNSRISKLTRTDNDNQMKLRNLKSQLKDATSGNQLTLSHNSTRIKQLQEELKVSRSKNDEINSKMTELKQSESRLQARVDDNDSRLQSAMSNQGLSSAEVRQMTQSTASSAANSAKASVESSLKTQYVLKASRNQNDSLAVKEQLQDLNAKLTSSHDKTASLQQTVKTLRDQLSSINSGNNKTIDKLMSKANQQSSQLQDARQKIIEANQQVAKANQTIKHLQNQPKTTAKPSADINITKALDSNTKPASEPKPDTDFGASSAPVPSEDYHPKETASSKLKDMKLNNLDEKVKKMEKREQARIKQEQNSANNHRHFWNL